MPLFETACSALPFLSARWVEMGLQPSGHLSDLLDRPTNCFRCPIQVQDQTRPQAVGGFQAVGPLGDHPRLVVDPLHRRTRLMRVEVEVNRCKMRGRGFSWPLARLPSGVIILVWPQVVSGAAS